MRYTVFFRNVNLGRPNCPTKAQLEAAFIEAGAGFAASFQVNGTLVFDVAPPTEVRHLYASAYALLQRRRGLREPGFVRRVDYLATLLNQNPFANSERESVYELCVTFLHRNNVLPALTIWPRRDDVEVIARIGDVVCSVSRKIGNSPGSPNALLEKLTGLPATTRNWNTITRLVEKFG